MPSYVRPGIRKCAKNRALSAWCTSCATCSEDASRPPRMGVRGAQGRVRHGIPGIRPRQGRDGRHGDGIQEAQGDGQLPQGGRRGDDDLPAARVSRGAPQAHPHEQHDRTAQLGDQAAHARGRQPPRRRQRPHARLRAHQVRHCERMVGPRYLDMSRLDDNLVEAD